METLPIIPKYESVLKPYGISAHDCICLRFQQGEFVIRQGFPIDYLFFMVKGAVQTIIMNAAGQEILLNHSFKEGAFGEVELFLGENTAISNVQAETELICLCLPQKIALEYMQTNPKFTLQLGKDLASKLQHSTYNILTVSTRSALKRLCSYLLAEQKDGIFRGKLAEAARKIGVSYRHLWRMMNKLCEDGIISKQEEGYYIKDIQRLKYESKE